MTGDLTKTYFRQVAKIWPETCPNCLFLDAFGSPTVADKGQVYFDFVGAFFGILYFDGVLVLMIGMINRSHMSQLYF